MTAVNSIASFRPRMIPFGAVRPAFKSGGDTPSAYLERCLEEVDRWEPYVGAFVVLNKEKARDQAKESTSRWRDGRQLSPIDGMPIGIKDILETADMPTQMGSDLFTSWESHRDSASVQALRECGAVVLGKTVTTEFAAPPPRGTRNPWDPSRTPGGSSSGSAAAVATGMIPVALGTQGIGSILRPASYCGCIGFKPTYGSINRGGSHDGLSQSTHGVLASTLEDAWVTLRAIVDHIGGDPGFPGLYGPTEPPPARRPARLAVLQTAGWVGADAAAKCAFEDVLKRMEAEGTKILAATSSEKLAKLERGLSTAMPISLRINAWEMRWPLNTYRNRDSSKISPLLLQRLAEAEAMGVDDYRALLIERERVRGLWQALDPDIEGAVTLSAGGPAPVGLQSSGGPVFAVTSSYLGIPAVSLPLLEIGGLPVGVQLVGFKDRDADLISIARWLAAVAV